MIALVRGSQEPEAILQNLKNTFGKNLAVVLGLRIEDRENQILLGQPRGVLNVHLPGERKQLGEWFRFQALDIKAVGTVAIHQCSLFLGEFGFRRQIIPLCSGGLGTRSAATRSA